MNTVILDPSLSEFALTNPDYKWQVIFKTAEGQDYCRETRASKFTQEEVLHWAETQIRYHEHVTGAEIQKF